MLSMCGCGTGEEPLLEAAARPSFDYGGLKFYKLELLDYIVLLFLFLLPRLGSKFCLLIFIPSSSMVVARRFLRPDLSLDELDLKLVLDERNLDLDYPSVLSISFYYSTQSRSLLSIYFLAWGCLALVMGIWYLQGVVVIR